MVGGRQGGVTRQLGTDIFGGERRQIDQEDVSQEAAEFFTDAAMEMVTLTSTEATTMMEGKWEYPPVTQGLGQDGIWMWYHINCSGCF